MKDHESYDTPLEWPENVFGEELGGGTPPADGDDPVAEPTDDELDDVDVDEDDDEHDHDHGDGEHSHGDESSSDSSAEESGAF